MMFQIRFTAGEHEGDAIPLEPGQAVSVGRSHSNTFRVAAMDVSGRHVIVRADRDGGVSAEVLSSRITRHNDRAVNIGDIFELKAGDTVQMGENTVFTIEPCEAGDEQKTVMPDEDAKTVRPDPPVGGGNDGGKTVIEPTTGVSENAPGNDTIPNVPTGMGEDPNASDETVAFQTRAASDEELENIKKAFRIKHRKKMFLIAFPIFLFFAGAIFLYFHLRPVKEEFVTWPKNKRGEFLNDFCVISPYLALAYPKVPGVVLKKNAGTIEIETRIGKFQDVRLHILVFSSTDPSSLRIDHPAAFDRWMDKMREKTPTLSFGGYRTTIFLNRSRGAGVPLSYVSYTRRVGNDDFWGYALFIRNAAQSHVVMIEVPIGDRWRAEPFMRGQAVDMVIYAIRRTEEHWEGSGSYRRDTDAATDLREAASFIEREAPVHWGRIFYLIRSALIKSAAAGDKEKLAEAKGMLVKLRKQQTAWYNTQKLAYQYAARNGDKATMRSIQSTGESVFSSEFQYSDFRYDLIKRKDWK